MKPLFDRLHVYLAQHASAVLADLRPGASDKEIRAAERAMKLKFPDDIRAAYRIHDGQQTHGFDNAFRPLIYGNERLCLERMVEEWKIGRDLYKKDQHYPYWRPHWIPLTFDGIGLIHYDPERYSIIDSWHPDHEGWVGISDSFADFLADLVNDLESGQATVSETPLVPIEVFEQWQRENES
jgi:cell wall assembly regulator SMI1